MANYFQSSKNSELSELQTDLNSMNLDVKKEAAKQVIAMMTIGKDASSLFPHMVKCMETNSIELKKLVYLYIINYAKSKADLAIMAVNSFQKDAREKSSPLLRALAIRTMGCIRIEKITQEFFDSLKNGLQDYDPYVKKTAALAVAKLYSISPKMVVDQDLIKLLQNLLQDGNANVVANTCASLLEISNSTGKNYFKFKKEQNLNKVLSALNESNEWGQIYILEAISTHDPKNTEEAEQICERIMPRLAHSNPAVLLSSIKVLLKNIDYIKEDTQRNQVIKKLSAPLISLFACEPELQYVALRNISFILQKQPLIFENNVKVFYCKFNDPVYVKLEKVDILVKVSDKNNCEQILLELKEYSSDVDMELVGAAIKAIGQIVIKIEESVKTAAVCIADIIKNGQTLALQEAVVVAKDILRKYPDKYDNIVEDLVKKVDEFYEIDAKAAILWIVGEYAEKIKTSQKIIENYCNSFLEEPDPVKLAILTACVKLYLKKPDTCEQLIQGLLKKATDECDNPDLRDRAYIYWRMLSTSPEKTAQVLLSKRPNISNEIGFHYSNDIIEELLAQISTICSIYHKTPDEMIKLYGMTVSQGMVARATQGKINQAQYYAQIQKDMESKKVEEHEEKPKEVEPKKQKAAKLDDDSNEEEQTQSKSKKDKKSSVNKNEKQQNIIEQPQQANLLDDLLGMGTSTSTPQSANVFGKGLDQLDFGNSQPVSGYQQQNQQVDLLGGLIDISSSSQQAQNFSNNNPFGNMDFQEQNQADDGPGWADAFGDSSSQAQNKYSLNFANSPLQEVLNSSTQGSKQKKSGLQVNSAINFNPQSNQLEMEIEFINSSGEIINDFDLMIKQNSFGIGPDVPCSKHGITYPAPFETSKVQILPLKIDKKNADTKNPPKHPFTLQIALKSSLDIFYFNLPCQIHSLINFSVEQSQRLTQEEFRKFWDMITPDKQFSFEVGNQSQIKAYQGFQNLPEDLKTCLKNNGFNLIAETTKQQTGQRALYFGSKTVNNLPLMLEIIQPSQPNGDQKSFQVNYRVPVLPLKPLFEDSLKFILSQR